MKWLTELKEYKVCDIDKVVLRVDARSAQIVLHPLWRWANLTALNSHTSIARASLRINNLHVNCKVSILNSKLIYARHLKLCVLTLTLKICYKVTRNTDMRCSIYTVRGKADCDKEIILNMIVLACRGADNSILRQLDNTLVASTNAQLILRAEHTQRLNATNLATLNLKALLSTNRIEHSTNGCAHNLKTLTAVSSAADNTERSLSAYIDSSNVEVVRIWMILTSEHLTHNNTLKATTNGLDLLKTLDLKTNVGQQGRYLLCRQIYIGIIFKPFERNIHI